MSRLWGTKTNMDSATGAREFGAGKGGRERGKKEGRTEAGDSFRKTRQTETDRERERGISTQTQTESHASPNAKHLRNLREL